MVLHEVFLCPLDKLPWKGRTLGVDLNRVLLELLVLTSHTALFPPAESCCLISHLPLQLLPVSEYSPMESPREFRMIRARGGLIEGSTLLLRLRLSLHSPSQIAAPLLSSSIRPSTVSLSRSLGRASNAVVSGAF